MLHAALGTWRATYAEVADCCPAPRFCWGSAEVETAIHFGVQGIKLSISFTSGIGEGNQEISAYSIVPGMSWAVLLFTCRHRGTTCHHSSPCVYGMRIFTPRSHLFPFEVGDKI